MSFRDMITQRDNKSLNEEVQGINNHGIGNLVVQTLHMISQVHVWHLLCPSGQKHTALGCLYGGLNDQVDILAERFIAQGGVLNTANVSIMPFYDEATVRQQLEEYRSLVTSSITNRPDMAAINDAVVDLQEIIDSNLYKFNLS